MNTITANIDVDAPINEVYDQWTQFEAFPEFMEGVERVRQLDDTHLEWTAKIAGREKTWTAEIGEQEPNARITWHSTSGAENAGAVAFEDLGDSRTRVTLEMGIDPEGPIENLGDALGLPERQVKEDLERFKTFIESRGTATGAWRGEIEHGEVERASTERQEPVTS